MAQIDSLIRMNTAWIEQIETDLSLKHRYKLYPTENIYTLLLLDTKTGKVWQLVKGEEGGTLWQQMIVENLNDTNKYTYSPKPQ